jgi:stalled ribosome alternative rescue factor ArfA
MKNKSKHQKKLKKKNPMAKLLRTPMLRNKIVQNKKKVYNRKKVIQE